MADIEMVRRSFMKAVGAGIAGMGVGFGAAAPAQASAAALGRPRAGGKLNPVNLYVLTSSVKADAQGKGSLTVRVGNNGPNPTSGPVALTVVTPYFVNIDRSGTNPEGCLFLLADSRPNVPEILQCIIPPGLAPGAERELTIPVLVLPNGPSLPNKGRVTVGCEPVDGAPLDQDIRLENAWAGMTVLQPDSVGQRTARTDGNAVNLYFRYEFPAMMAGTPAFVNVFVGNAGPNAATADTLFTMRTPYYVNLAPDQPLPDGAELIYRNPNPAVPEVLAVPVPASALTVGSEYQMKIPLVSVAGGPTGYRSAWAMVAPGAPDVDIDLNPSLHSIGLVLLG